MRGFREGIYSKIEICICQNPRCRRPYVYSGQNGSRFARAAEVGRKIHMSRNYCTIDCKRITDRLADLWRQRQKDVAAQRC